MSSFINNIITTDFRARGSQAIAEMRGVAQGFGGITRQAAEMSNMSGRINNQWRALGTTIRYALAGSAVFGVTRLVGQLKDVQTQLGLIAAIGQQAGGQPFTFRQVTDLGEQLQTSAINAIQPINAVNDATVNFLSTVQGVRGSEIPGIIEDIGKSAQLSQTPVEDLTKAATTMNVAFGRANNSTNLREFTRVWYAAISTVPGGIAAAPQIAQQLPTVATQFMMAPGRNTSPQQAQAQMMSLVIGALRTGAPPSVALRGLTYLAQSIAQPTGKAGQALAGVGITPEFVQEHGIRAGIMRLLHTIAPVSAANVHRIGLIPDENLDQMDATGGQFPGVSAREMTRLRAMIPRIHGIRAAIILASQLQRRGQVASLDEELKLVGQAQDDQLQGALNLSKAWGRFRQRAKLQEAANAVNVLSLQVAQSLEPLLNYPAGKLTGLARLAQHHRQATTNIVRGGVGIVAAMGLARMFNLGRFIPGLGGLLGGGGRTLVGQEAARAALSGGGGVLGGSPQNPLYVIVVGQLFGQPVVGPTTGPGPGPDPESKGSWLARRAPWLARASVRAIPDIAALAAIYETRNWQVKHIAPYTDKPVQAFGRAVRWQERHITDPVLSALGIGNATHNQQVHSKLVDAVRHYYGNSGIADVYGYHRGQPDMKGRAIVDLMLAINQDGKIVRKRVHIPVDMATGGKIPLHRGKAGKGTR